VRVEPAPEILIAARHWLEPLRGTLDSEFIAAYLTGSVLTDHFDARHSRVNILIVARTLDLDRLEALAAVMPPGAKPGFEPLLVTRAQVERSLDVFPIEWFDIIERRFRLEGDDVFAGIEIPRQALRMQCEHELRAKHLRLRQAFVVAHGRADQLAAALRLTASGLAVLFRTLLRLRGETAPVGAPHTIERVAELYGLDSAGLLGPHLLRYSNRKPKLPEIQATYRKFLVELDRLIAAVDEMRVS